MDKLSLQPYLVEAPDGTPIPCDYGRVLVPENRTNPASPLIEVAFLRFRSKGKHPGTPVLQVQGGPGAVAVDPPPPWTLQIAAQVVGSSDYVHVEQRGIGQSRPRLDIVGQYGLPLDRPMTWEDMTRALGDYMERGAQFWRDQGRDLMGYNVREMAHDVDAVREALGYGTICMTGGSFGSHFSLAVLRYHGDRVERCVVRDVEGPNHTVKLPSTVQRYLQLYDQMVRADSGLSKHIPDLLALMAEVLDRLERQPVTATATHPETKKPVVVTMGKLDLQVVTADGLGSTAFLRALPRRYFEMRRGDFSWLAEQVVRNRTHRAGNVMPALVDLASGATADRLARVRRETPQCLLGNAINDVLFDIGGRLGNPDLGDEFRRDLKCHIPTLFCSPGLDPRTPVTNAEEVMAGFARGVHQIVQGVSHDFLTRMSSHAQAEHIASVVAFLRGDPVTTTQIVSPFAFDPVE